MKGTIVLYHNSGMELARKDFGNAMHRKHIMKQWEIVCGHDFNNYYYHIIPEINENDENERTNTPAGKNRRINGAGVRS